jgi:glucokinase
VGRGTAVVNQTLGVLGPGTGLGVSGAIYAGDYWMPLQGEGGHISYGPLNEREAAVFDVIRRHHNFISAETLISGPGLVLLYESIAKRDGVGYELLSPQQITDKALNAEHAAAEEAVDMFCGILGAIAGNLALTLGARGGVFVGGGIVPRLGDYFYESSFRMRFENNSRFGQYLADIPTYVICSKYPGLTGAAIATRHQYTHLGVSSISH